jgi:hypothetical protein
MRTRLYAISKRIRYALRGQWPTITIQGPMMVKVKSKRRCRQYKPEYITGEPDRTEYYRITS